MQTFFKWTCLCFFLVAAPGALLMAQTPEEADPVEDNGIKTEVSEPEDGDAPLDDVV